MRIDKIPREVRGCDFESVRSSSLCGRRIIHPADHHLNSRIGSHRSHQIESHLDVGRNIAASGGDGSRFIDGVAADDGDAPEGHGLGVGIVPFDRIADCDFAISSGDGVFEQDGSPEGRIGLFGAAGEGVDAGLQTARRVVYHVEDKWRKTIVWVVGRYRKVKGADGRGWIFHVVHHHVQRSVHRSGKNDAIIDSVNRIHWRIQSYGIELHSRNAGQTDLGREDERNLGSRCRIRKGNLVGIGGECVDV